MIFGSTEWQKCSGTWKFCTSSVFAVIPNIMENIAEYIIGKHQKKKSIEVVELETLR